MALRPRCVPPPLQREQPMAECAVCGPVFAAWPCADDCLRHDGHSIVLNHLILLALKCLASVPRDRPRFVLYNSNTSQRSPPSSTTSSPACWTSTLLMSGARAQHPCPFASPHAPHSRNAERNLEAAFKAAEALGIAQTLDVEDVLSSRPDHVRPWCFCGRAANLDQRVECNSHLRAADIQRGERSARCR